MFSTFRLCYGRVSVAVEHRIDAEVVVVPRHQVQRDVGVREPLCRALSHDSTRSFISRCSSASRPVSSPDSRSASSAVVTNE